MFDRQPIESCLPTNWHELPFSTRYMYKAARFFLQLSLSHDHTTIPFVRIFVLLTRDPLFCFSMNRSSSLTLFFTFIVSAWRSTIIYKIIDQILAKMAKYYDILSFVRKFLLILWKLSHTY